MVTTPDPREDALAKRIATDVLTNCAAHFAQPEAFSAGLGADPQRYIDMAINNAAKIILAALSDETVRAAAIARCHEVEVSDARPLWQAACQAIERKLRDIRALTPSPTPYVRPAESAVVLTLIDALTGLESSYEEGEGVSYARLEARSAIKTAQDFLSAPTPYVRPAAEIRAEIEKLREMVKRNPEMWRPAHALEWVLTPPTTEKETPQ